jgi:hypothetical protein
LRKISRTTTKIPSEALILGLRGHFIDLPVRIPINRIKSRKTGLYPDVDTDIPYRGNLSYRGAVP